MLICPVELAKLVTRHGHSAAVALLLRDSTHASVNVAHEVAVAHVDTPVTGRPRPAPPPQWRQRARKKARMFPLRPAYHDGAAPTTAASVIAACKQVCDADPRVTGALAAAAAKAGRGFTTAYRNEVLRRYEMLKLVHILPAEVLASISGLTPAAFARRNPSDVAQLLFAKANAVEHDTIRKARLSLARLLEHLEGRGIDWDDGGFGCLAELDLFGFLMDVHIEATSNPANKAGGFSAVWGVFDGLTYLVKHFGLRLPTAEIKNTIPKRGVKRGASAVVTGAIALPPEALHLLCAYAANANKPPVTRSWARAAAFTCLSSLRQANSQHIHHYGEINVLGKPYLLSQHLDNKKKDKSPVVFVTPLLDMSGNRAWFDDTKDLLWEGADFLWAASSGDPLSSTSYLLPMPLDEAKIQAALRLVLREACHMSPPQASIYTKHSLRKTMVSVAQSAGCPFEMCVELGHWSGTCLDRSFLVPAEDLRRKRALECMKMPQRYSANTRIRRVARIVGNQVDRMSAYLQKVRRTSRSDPFDTIWEFMGAYEPAREGA
jgi:hypothetical protein